MGFVSPYEVICLSTTTDSKSLFLSLHESVVLTALIVFFQTPSMVLWVKLKTMDDRTALQGATTGAVP